MSHRDTFYNRNINVPECSTCRSSYMTKDEIAQERRNSGWNPYWAEEENDRTDNLLSDDSSGEYRGMWIPEEIRQPKNNREERAMDPVEQGLWGILMGNDPALEAQRLAERDLRQLQSMYPEAAKIMLPYIEEVCDRMEYDGSSMYAQYPDRMTVYRLAEEIFEKVQDQYPEQMPVVKDEILAMQYRPSGPSQPPQPLPPGRPSQPPQPFPPGQPTYGYNQPGVNWVQDLARVLLLNEMHHRRRRKKNLFN